MCETAQVQRNVDALDLDIPAGLMEEINEVVAPIKNQMWFEGKEENNIPKN
jgi:L-galactose dehydrogenase